MGRLPPEQADHRPGHRVVMGIMAAADGRVDPHLYRALDVADREALDATAAVMDHRRSDSPCRRS